MSVVRLHSEAPFAGVAQLAEQLICNQQVAGSSPITSSNTPSKPYLIYMDGFPSGQREQTVNLPSVTSVVRIHPHPPNAGMAELADAYGSGPYEGSFMQVQVLFPAPLKRPSTFVGGLLFVENSNKYRRCSDHYFSPLPYLYTMIFFHLPNSESFFRERLQNQKPAYLRMSAFVLWIEILWGM